ncbi:MAG: hypothetical protein RL095_3935 [Verrucomicrobiota bacterium]|jgi:hypothetical protein
MPPRRQILRLALLLALLLGLPALLYVFWQPGSERRDGAHDRGQNGLWLQHGWLGDDEWFQKNSRPPQKFRGIHAGLERQPLPAHYRGVAVYCEWEMDAAEWRLWQEAFCK